MPDSAAPVFDRAQLDRRTLGNAALELEILALFVTEAQRLLQQVERAADPRIRNDRLEAMIALARNTGAVRLAQVARALKTQVTDPDLGLLREAVGETIAHIHAA